MRAPGLGLELDPGDRRAAPRPAPPDAPMRDGLLAFRIDLHPPTDLVVEAPEREIDNSLLALWLPVDDRPVGLADPALLE